MRHNPRKTEVTLATLIDSTIADLGSLFETMEWAEDEIKRASRRHRGHADALYHSFKLLMPRTELGSAMTTEFVYRSHAAELLERVVAGQNTRPPTAAELCAVLSETSQQVPMHDAAAGLYFRTWMMAFPKHPLTAENADQRVHYEELFGSRIDELLNDMRRKFADPERRLSDDDCGGMHHGKKVNCQFLRENKASALVEV